MRGCFTTATRRWRTSGARRARRATTTLANFYQGIIKAAAGYHHLLRDNYRGTVNLLSDTFRLLEPYRPRTLGVDVDSLLEGIQATLVRAEGAGAGAAGGV